MKRLLAFILVTSPANAYEVETHGLLTLEAYKVSVLQPLPSPNPLYVRLGFDRQDAQDPYFQPDLTSCQSNGTDPKQAAYIDPVGTWLEGNVAPDSSNRKFRCVQDYEKASFPPVYRGLVVQNGEQVGPTPALRLEAWLMRGAIREDDLKASNYATSLRPDPDPWGDQDRPIRHFFVPQLNASGLVPIPVFGPPSSLQWAMGVASNPLTPAPAPDLNRGNHFSYPDAKRDFYQALTYKVVQSPTAALSKRDSDTRQNLWASTMLSLGHVVHLLQDQASPQHSRGEPHNYVCRGFFSLFNQSVATRTYENFINFRVIRSKFDFDAPPPAGQPNYVSTNPCEEKRWIKMFQESGQESPPSLNRWLTPGPNGGVNNYPLPQFSIVRKFFTTRTNGSTMIGDQTPPELNERAGLGDYSNRGFYTEGNMEGSALLPFISPPRLSSDPSFSDGMIRTQIVPGLGNVKVKGLLWRVPDAVAPNYDDPNLVNGKAPIVSYGQWGFFGVLGGKRRILTLDNYNQMADMLAPRAIAYSAGLINYFFRGKLEIEPIDQRIFAVINQGEPHTVNAEGYPIRISNNKVFGFEKIRLKVRNLTDPIIESGTNLNVPQRAGVGTLVAVARYHRNACYKPDLTGERQYRYSPPPALLVDEPTCALNLPTRTAYQEISVSATLNILSEADLPGGSGGTPPASVEKTFDFSADPIPVNATDLFIQVVYRGQLGDETDGIAVGNYDLREPTFYAGWNNTDYAYNEITTSWQSAGGAFPARVMQGIRTCAGFPSKWVYQYNTSDPQPGLGFPIAGDAPGVLRLAFLFGKPALPNQRVSFRSYPIMSVAPSAQVRLGSTAGQSRQASMEIYAPSGANALPLPSNCGITPPAAGSNVWCFDPVFKRRGLAFGEMAHPLYYSTGAGNDGPDVDAPPAQIPFGSQIIRTGGTIRFDDVTLQNCPAGPALLSPEKQRWIELREAAWDLGIDPDAPSN